MTTVAAPQNTDAKRLTPEFLAQAGRGRPKGTPNKTTLLAKEAIAVCGEMLGGADRLFAWCKEDPRNERTFWGTIYPKLLPLQVHGPDGPDGNPTLPAIEIRLVQPGASAE